MERFYRLLKHHSGEPFDPAEAARLEVEWWRAHRVHQYSSAVSDGRALVDALAALYAYAFGVPETVVRIAAEQRALAMGYCDQWVRAGCDLESSLIAEKQRRAGAFVRVVGRSCPTGMTAASMASQGSMAFLDLKLPGIGCA